jgi:diguanylate cyclase (GGDEF)-like protein
LIDRSLRILFVEDNPGDIRLVREMLIAADEERIELSFVSRVGEVTARLAQGGIDVILLDLNLPDANGLSAVEWIHRDYPEIPLVVLSSVIDEELAMASLQAGAQDFLVKGMINGPLLTRSIFYAIKRKDLEDQLLFSLHHDSLTGLYNRKFLISELERAIRRSQSAGGKFAVLLLDLSRFKSINDTYGHGVGDSLLIEVGRILSDLLEPGMILSRMGGDEFGFILPSPGEGDDVGRFARKIRENLCRVHTIDSIEIDLDLVIGISLYPDDGTSAEDMVRKAARALDLAIDRHDFAYTFYNNSMDEVIRKRKALMAEFSRAIEDSQLLLHFQPIISLRSRALAGVEALVRWNHPERGLLLPGSFLPDIAGTELLVSMGDWVLERALEHLTRWSTRGLDVPININVDLLQLRREDFVPRLFALLDAHPEIPADRLELEILETSTAEGFHEFPEVLRRIHGRGVRLAIDDFGTGYSSLSYLKNLPVDTLKVDRGFVMGMLDNRENLAIIESIASLARIFGHSVVAEGMERPEFIPLLQKLGCDFAQGYAIARPMVEEDFLAWEIGWRSIKAPEPFRPISPAPEISVLSKEVEYFVWLQGVLSLAQKACFVALSPEEESYFQRSPLHLGKDGETESVYRSIPTFTQLESAHKEADALSCRLLDPIRERDLEAIRDISRQMLLLRDEILGLYGTLQKEVLFQTLLGTRERQ